MLNIRNRSIRAAGRTRVTFSIIEQRLGFAQKAAQIVANPRHSAMVLPAETTLATMQIRNVYEIYNSVCSRARYLF